MRILTGRAAAARVESLAARENQYAAIEPAVRRIVNDIRRNGDSALRRYAARWDNLAAVQHVQVPESQLRISWEAAPAALRAALRRAAANIRRFAEWQKPKSWTRTRDGIRLGQIVRALDSVGCYVPGGRYPLVSTLLMTVIPAQVAGVPNIRVVSPSPHPDVLAAAAMLGVREFYRVGGAQAVAALAFGTETIPGVDKIVGPGNKYVTIAKKLVAFDCAIDFIAGPTEALLLSDNGNPDHLAADLIAQAEHDPDALVIFITTSRTLAKAVTKCADVLSANNPTARAALRNQGIALVASSHEQALAWTNAIACEHVTLSRRDLPALRNAGSVFVGNYSAQSAGDYASGTNHVLPTGGATRFRGGLSVLDFVKIITVQELSAAGLRRIAPIIETLAEAEGLAAHAESVRVRCRRA
jgi:histidinol dehydrogenase